MSVFSMSLCCASSINPCFVSSFAHRDWSGSIAPGMKAEKGKAANGDSSAISLADNEAKETSNRDHHPSLEVNNPLWQEQHAFLQSLSIQERQAFFSSKSGMTPERRTAIWMQQADLGCVDRYAWATPDRRALRILHHFAPLIEIGCGANAYWCRQLIQEFGTDIVGYDTAPDIGGSIAGNASASRTNAKRKRDEFAVQLGGPDVLSSAEHQHRTLFLCYPDENDHANENNDEGDDDQDAERVQYSMAADCLQHYTGTYLIHVGELMSIQTPSLGRDTAPYGRSSAPEFQERLFSEFHCVLQVALPNWLHAQDTLTVWKRSTDTTTIVFENDQAASVNAGTSDHPADEDDEVVYRHIPLEERLPVDIAAPCLQHLLDHPNSKLGSPTN
jgi:hypothetical protein